MPLPARRCGGDAGRELRDKFRDEFQAHVDQGGCPFGGESSLEGMFAPVDQHTHAPVAEVPA